ncbi:hypothetical protein [Conexivisphaera calida]|uniref:SF3 helicase domain-containing protein n=1 Tax=Conexivisphaera calida TaxID=1874277 RepID=A0A4P2VG30_9ARCH|nr:hypothetical protein [Conexivisphaera calida]BBE42423.1 hypothetical protein NAS2_1034 [Conexivisphaera calida]
MIDRAGEPPEFGGVRFWMGVVDDGNGGRAFRVEREDGSLVVERPLGPGMTLRPSDRDAIVDEIARAAGGLPQGEMLRAMHAVEKVLADAGGRVELPALERGAPDAPDRAGAGRRDRGRIPASEFEPAPGASVRAPPSPGEFLRDVWSYSSVAARCFVVSIHSEGRWAPRAFCLDEYGTLDAVVAAALEYAGSARPGENAYFTVLPLARKPERGRGTSADVGAARWLFADLDYKEEVPAPEFEGCREGGGGALECYYRDGDRWIHVKRPPLREVLGAIAGVLGARPTYAVDSGSGYHLYFRLTGEVSGDEFVRAELALAGRLEAAGIRPDPQVKDAARVLRLPGSTNPRTNRICRVIYQSDAALDPDALTRREPGAGTSAPVPRPATGGPFITLEPEDVARAASLLLPGFTPDHKHMIALCFGGWGAHRLVHPAGALAVVKRLVELSGDHEPMDRYRAVVDSYARAGLWSEEVAKEVEAALGIRPPRPSNYGNTEVCGAPRLQEELEKAGVQDAARIVEGFEALVAPLPPRTARAPEAPPPESPYIRDALDWWGENFSLPADAERWRAAQVASYVADALVGAAHVRFVKICTDKKCELYAVDGARLVDADIVIEEALAAPGVREYQSVHLPTIVRRDLSRAARALSAEDPNPPWALNTLAGVLDLRTLELRPHGGGGGQGPYFTYVAPVRPDPVVIKAIVDGAYDITGNAVYRLWRGHFDDENWRYFVSSVGTWLSPRNHRHLAFLVGDTKIGKTSLLSALCAPIEPIVSHADLGEMMGYTFGKESLLGRRIVVQDENAASVLRDLARLNKIFGERGKIEVYRKGREPLPMPALRAAMFSMNDMPLIKEMRGSTLAAFLDRLSIIQMRAPEGFEPKPELVDAVTPEEALYFLLWARRELEKNGWQIEKRGEEELRGLVFEKSWVLSGFWSDCVEESGEVRAGDLYTAYQRWAQRHGVAAVGRNAFYDLVAQKAARVLDRDKSLKFVGVRLRPGAGEC